MKTVYGILLILGILSAWAVAQFDGANAGVDEYGKKIDIEGTIREHPYGVLEVPLGKDPSGQPVNRSFLLVDPLKADAQREIEGLDGKKVRITGTMIYRANLAVLEVFEVHPLEQAGPPPTALLEEGPLVLRGEIVDTKCGLGRMKPGNGVAHRECAIRCIAGGIPPTLWVHQGEGEDTYYLLEDLQGRRVNEKVLDYVADPVEITGVLVRRGDIPVLRFDPESINRLL